MRSMVFSENTILLVEGYFPLETIELETVVSPGVSYPPVYGRRLFVHREHCWGNHMGKDMG
jgi:hypothetical protein